MLFSDDVLFIHPPKTGGISITTYLLNNLKGPLTFSKPIVARKTALRSVYFDDVDPRLEVIRGARHETLAQAVELLRNHGRELGDFRHVLAVIRNPYDLEVSCFEHLRKPRVVERRGADTAAVAAALTGNFEHFAQTTSYFGMQATPIESYYTIDGEMPPNLRIVRFESMRETLPELVAPFSFERFPLPHENKTESRHSYRGYLTPAAEAAIRTKYAFLFDYYPREDTAASGNEESDHEASRGSAGAVRP